MQLLRALDECIALLCFALNCIAAAQSCAADKEARAFKYTVLYCCTLSVRSAYVRCDSREEKSREETPLASRSRTHCTAAAALLQRQSRQSQRERGSLAAHNRRSRPNQRPIGHLVSPLCSAPHSSAASHRSASHPLVVQCQTFAPHRTAN